MKIKQQYRKTGCTVCGQSMVNITDQRIVRDTKNYLIHDEHCIGCKTLRFGYSKRG